MLLYGSALLSTGFPLKNGLLRTLTVSRSGDAKLVVGSDSAGVRETSGGATPAGFSAPVLSSARGLSRATDLPLARETVL